MRCSRARSSRWPAAWCGWFVVLRGQVFAGDALSHVAFPGALAAAAAGIDERVGLFAATVAVGAGIGALGRGADGAAGRAGAVPAEDTAIGIVFTFILGLGVFFLALFSTSSAGGSGIQVAHTLFGSIFGLGAGEARLAAVIARGGDGADARDRAAAAVRLDRSRRRRRAGRAGAAARHRLRCAARRRRGRGDPGCRRAVAAGAARRSGGRCTPPRQQPAGGRRARWRYWQSRRCGEGLRSAYAVPSLPPGTAIVGIAVATYCVSTILA